ncbi:unnamed protein product [Sphenostylis stenocarpa]|uniref:Uncharacterized protein n=1 Tax=Sphenostylis stenocarpa TaxID=92480 RepID=A0AA86W5J5_9FABA|nr:unnamed protein product [Sphenostylis stenocarpa]
MSSGPSVGGIKQLRKTEPIVPSLLVPTPPSQSPSPPIAAITTLTSPHSNLAFWNHLHMPPLLLRPLPRFQDRFSLFTKTLAVLPTSRPPRLSAAHPPWSFLPQPSQLAREGLYGNDFIGG